MHFTINWIPQFYLCFHNLIELLTELQTDSLTDSLTELHTELIAELCTESPTEYLIELSTDFPRTNLGVIIFVPILLNYVMMLSPN